MHISAAIGDELSLELLHTAGASIVLNDKVAWWSHRVYSYEYTRTYEFMRVHFNDAFTLLGHRITLI